MTRVPIAVVWLQDTWEQTAAAWDRDAAPFLPELVHKAAAGRWRTAVNPEAGSGTIALALAPSTEQTFALEDDPRRVARLEGAVREGSRRNVTVRPGRVTQLPFPSKTFDLGFWCVPVLVPRYLADGLRELGRVLMDGGDLRLVVWTYPEIAEQPIGESVPFPAAELESFAGPILEQARASGFSEVEVEHVAFGCVAPDAKSLIAAIGAMQVPSRTWKALGLDHVPNMCMSLPPPDFVPSGAIRTVTHGAIIRAVR